MTREEMVELRRELFDRVKRMRHVGDYGVGAADNRDNAEAILKLLDHLLERMR